MLFNENKLYSTKEVAEKCEVSYQSFRCYRERYEEHLKNYFDFEKIKKGNGWYYKFTDQFEEFLPYKKAKSAARDKVLRRGIKNTIAKDNRQTGSNIARIIRFKDEVYALDLSFSSLTTYVRQNLAQMIKEGYYVKSDYVWCYLNKWQNIYVELSEEEVKELRECFKVSEEEENIYAELKEKQITEEEATKKLGKIRVSAFTSGIEKFEEDHGYRPMKVPVYSRSAF